MLAIINAELPLRDHLFPNAVLFVEDGKITDFGEMRSAPIPEDCEVLDAEGLYVGPGLVDAPSTPNAAAFALMRPLTTIAASMQS